MSDPDGAMYFAQAAGRQRDGAKFSLSAFHDELIGAGALPMDGLEQRMNEWIARTAAQGGAGKAE